MAAAEKLSIALTPELTADIRDAVATGEYASTSEVIRDALRAWKQVRQGRAAAVDGLRRLWAEGVDDDDRTLDVEDIKQRGRARLAALEAAREA